MDNYPLLIADDRELGERKGKDVFDGYRAFDPGYPRAQTE